MTIEPVPVVIIDGAQSFDRCHERGDVHLHRRAESLQRLVLDPDRATDAGVVHEHVDATEPVEHLGNEAFTVGVVRHVGHDDVCPGELGGERLEPIGSPGGQHYLRADAMEDGREVSAESRGGPRDHGDLTVESEVIEGRGDSW